MTMVVSYEIVDKQCACQQDRSPEGGSTGWTTKLQCVYVWLLMVQGGGPLGGKKN